MSKGKFLSVDPDHASLKAVHNLLLGGVSPRPIALVSSISQSGVNNLAPFSFFNAFGANPPYVAFSPAYSGRDGSSKDTLVNVKQTKECVIHAVSHDIAEQMSLASSAFAPDIDEFVKSGFTPIPSIKVSPPRLAESPFQMECKVEQILELGGTRGSGNLVLCRVVQFHVQEDLLQDGVIQPDLIDLIGRNSANYYTRASGAAVFELQKPAGIGMGMDALPEWMRTSTILRANDLGKLAGLSSLPTGEATKVYLADLAAGVHENAQSAYALAFVALKRENLASDVFKASVEQLARQALVADDPEFALHVLMSLDPA